MDHPSDLFHPGRRLPGDASVPVAPESRDSKGPSVDPLGPHVAGTRSTTSRSVGRTTDSAEHPSYVSLRMVLIMIALVMVVAGVFAIWYGPARVSGVVAATIAHHGTNAITPAPLSEAHAGDNADTDNCASCHLPMASPPSEKCLVCHTEIQERMTAGSGFHGKIAGSCRQCHTEHKGVEATLISLDRQAFNHGSTNFPLDGKHQAVPCEKCHEKTGPDTAGRMQYTGLDYKSCINCHHNPHNDPRASHCLECHTMQGWGRDKLTFDHDRDSQFPLLGAKLDCEKCHPRQTTNGRVQVRLFDWASPGLSPIRIGAVQGNLRSVPHGARVDRPLAGFLPCPRLLFPAQRQARERAM